MRETFECHECGLIYWGEMLNLVEGERSGFVGNHCPNCGAEDPEKRD